MSLMMDGDRVPTRWAANHGSQRAHRAEFHSKETECLRIALVNNMPDSALEDTEIQFFGLLDSAAQDLPVRVDLFSLPNIPRSRTAQQHLDKFYSGIDSLLSSRYDGVIVTGTEPRKSDLREEPYWSALTEVFDWAQQNTASAVLSCLAAHAGVLCADNITRHPKSDKLFGVFAENRTCEHPLTDKTSSVMPFPHSRWNEVREDELTASGYTVLTKSAEGGANLFVKKRGKSLFVHFQGHPEYGARTLLKEYRRDIGRFLRGERETYPSMPSGYFDEAAVRSLAAFRSAALHDPREQRLAEFPEAEVAERLEHVWLSPATRIYRNWLQYIAARRAETATPVPRTRAATASWPRSAKAV